MGKLLNLLSAHTKFYDGPPRRMDPTFGKDYFDGTRDTGYGGYRYDGRWRPIAQEVVKRYGLGRGARVLDLGCAKGFFLADLMDVCPGIEVCGIDISAYAISFAPEKVSPYLVVGSAHELNHFNDRSFDLITAMNTLHFLAPKEAELTLREMLRIGTGKFFVQVDAFTNEAEKERLLAWAPTIQTAYSVKDWLKLFKGVGYDGDYFWTFVRPTQSATAQTEK